MYYLLFVDVVQYHKTQYFLKSLLLESIKHENWQLEQEAERSHLNLLAQMGLSE